MHLYRIGPDGHQCTDAVHMDDLLIMSKCRAALTHLIDGLCNRYRAITLAHGPVVNYLGMSVDPSVSGRAEITMRGYIDEVVSTSGVHGTARTPATETREGVELVTEANRV